MQTSNIQDFSAMKNINNKLTVFYFTQNYTLPSIYRWRRDTTRSKLPVTHLHALKNVFKRTDETKNDIDIKYLIYDTCNHVFLKI